MSGAGKALTFRAQTKGPSRPNVLTAHVPSMLAARPWANAANTIPHHGQPQTGLGDTRKGVVSLFARPSRFTRPNGHTHRLEHQSGVPHRPATPKLEALAAFSLRSSRTDGHDERTQGPDKPSYDGLRTTQTAADHA